MTSERLQTTAPANSAAIALIAPMLRDALMLARTGRATPADIDLAMQLGAGYPEGPFALLNKLSPAQRAQFDAPDVDMSAAVSDADEAALDGPVGIVGTGTMAAGIVEALVRAGRRVRVRCRSQASLDRMVFSVAGRFARAIERGKMTPGESDAALALIADTYDLAELADCALIIEAVTEDLAVKRRLLADLHDALPPQIPVATNTSSYRVADLADAAPGRCLFAMHFFNPAGSMKLVELVFPQSVEPGFRARARGFCRSIGKVAIECADDRGFVVNRLLIPFLNDAVRAVEAGRTPEEIDRSMVEELMHPMGPLALIDLIGVDVTVLALEAMAETENDPRIAPTPMLRDMVAAGRLGRKSGAGFYDHGSGK